MLKLPLMKNRGSTTWLIIFLCAIVFGLGWFKIKDQHSKEVNLLNEEVKELNQEIESIKKSPNQEVEGLRESSLSSEATPSIQQPSPSPVPLETEQSQDIEPQTDTNSGCVECGE